MTKEPAPPPQVPQSEPQGSHRTKAMLRLAWVLLAVTAIALIANGAWNGPSSQDARDLAHLGMLLLILLFLGAALLGRGLRVRQIVRSLAVWSLVALVAAGIYAYRSEIVSAGGRVLAAFAPGVPIAGRLAGESPVSVVVMRSRSGQFAVRAHLDDVPVTMIIDTGASFVTLTLADAAGAGFDISMLAFTVPIRTANGVIRAAPVTIARLAIGTIERADLPALVAPPGSLTQSLLGMTFLETLGGYAISGDRLVLND